jgi:hypothetical protein
VDNCLRLDFLEEVKHTLAIADVQFVMYEALNTLLEPMLIPTCITLGAEKYGALVIVNAVDLPTLGCKVEAHFRPDEARRSCDENLLHLLPLL